MMQRYKWQIFIILFLTVTHSSSWAWNIGAKGRVLNTAIHTTYFMTPNNGEYEVRAKAYVGNYINGICNYNAIYDIGTEKLKTGDYIDIDAYALKMLIGTRFNCMTIYYYSRQLVRETFQLIYDGINYYATYPEITQITII